MDTSKHSFVAICSAAAGRCAVVSSCWPCSLQITAHEVRFVERNGGVPAGAATGQAGWGAQQPQQQVLQPATNVVPQCCGMHVYVTNLLSCCKAGAPCFTSHQLYCSTIHKLTQNMQLFVHGVERSLCLSLGLHLTAHSVVLPLLSNHSGCPSILCHGTIVSIHDLSPLQS